MPNITVFDKSLAEFLAHNASVIFSYPNAKIWNQNGVSLQRRIDEDAAFAELVTKLLNADNLQQYIVPSSSAAPTRCIDGRITKDWQADATEHELGPKVAGGIAHAALAHRIVNAHSIKGDLKFEADLQQVIQQYKAGNIGFGGHIDDHQSGANTGCGAVDNINLILERLQRPEPQEQLRGLTKIILGEAHDDSITDEVIGRMLYLDALKPSYMPKQDNDPEGQFLYKQTIVNMIRNEAHNDAAVPALTGIHNEVAAVLNFVPDTTLDTDRLSHDTNNELQVFGWDIWEMFEEARRLYPYTMHESVAAQQAAINDRMKHVTTRTLLGLATTMVLTDGSLKVVIVQP